MVKMCLIKKLLVLKHCNIVNNDYQQESRVLDTLFVINHLGQLLDILHKNYITLVY